MRTKRTGHFPGWHLGWRNDEILGAVMKTKNAGNTPGLCYECMPKWDRSLNFKASILCPLHAAAADFLEVAKELLQTHSDGYGGGPCDKLRAIIAEAEKKQ